MRFSPKSIFVGLVAIGLPIAVTVGWNLATPAKPPSATGASVDGAGGLGTAPERASTSRPDTAVRYPARPAPSASSPITAEVSRPPLVTGGAPTAPAAPPSATPSSPAPPVLTLPPVPTPTDPGEPSESTSTSPSPSPSSSASAQPSDH